MKKRQAATVISIIVVVLVALALVMHISPFNTSTGSGGFTPSTAPSNAGASTTATPSYPVLTSLDGTIVCLGGDEITSQLWMKMRDYSASDPSVKPYVEWLRNALAPKPHDALTVPWYPRYHYWWFNDRYGWSVPRPGEDSLVRMGVVELPFGAGLVVTAYQTGDGLTIVVHGTIINETGWRELLSRVGAFIGGVEGEVGNASVEWVLWRAELGGEGSYLDVNGVRLPVKQVIVLLEMPAYTINKKRTAWDREFSPYYWQEAEWAYWDVVGHPALALAIHLAYPPNSKPPYSDLTKRLTWSVVLTGVKHPGDNAPYMYYHTPFLLRKSGRGVCGEQSTGTSLFASNALGAYTAYATVSGLRLPHAISLIMYAGWNTIDTNRDGRPDAIVLRDTSGLSANFINKHLGAVVYYEPPLVYVDPERYGVTMINGELVFLNETVRYGYFYSGVVYAVLGLPDWLKSPWLNYAMEKSRFTKLERKVWSVMERLPPRPGLEETRGYLINYAMSLNRLDSLRSLIAKIMGDPVYTVPPSVALALGKVIGSLPVVYEAGTPSLRYPLLVRGSVEVYGSGAYFKGSAIVDGDNITVTIHYRRRTVEYNITVYVDGEKAYWERRYGSLFDSCPVLLSGCTRESEVAFVHDEKAYYLTLIVKLETGEGSTGGEQEEAVVEAEVRLTPVYVVEETPWGQMPLFDRFTGSAMVDQTNVTVVAYPYSRDEYNIIVYVNGSKTYTERTTLPATIAFKHGSVEYRVSLELPEPPVINETMEPELVPVDNVSIPLPNGTVINITMYRVNETIKVGNVTIVVFGYVSRLGIDLDIYVFGVPPGNYTVNITGLEANQTIIEYAGTLHVYLHYQAPENQLIPENTVIKATVQPLNLTIIIPIKG